MTPLKKVHHERCPWCSRQPVKVKHGRYASHLTPGGIKCMAIGQPKRKPFPPKER